MNANTKLKFYSFVVLFLLTFSSFSQLALESFESGIPSSWTRFQNQASSTPWSPTTDGYLASNGTVVNPALDNVGVGTSCQYYMVTPQFLVPSNGEIRFFTKQGSAANLGTSYQIRITTANQVNVNTSFVTLKTWNENTLNVGSPTTYQEQVVTIPSSITVGLPVYIAFVTLTSSQTGATLNADSWFVDNVQVITGCAKVTQSNFSASSILPYSANLNWVHPTTTNFEVQVLPQGGTPAATGTSTITTSFSATSLTPNTTYDVYIKSVCGSTSSTWAGPFPFTTAKVGLTCNTPIIVPPDVSTTPYILNSNLNTFYDASTYIPYTSQGLSCQPPTTPTTWNYLLGDHAFLSYTPTTSGLISVSMQAIGNSAINCYNQYTSVFIFDSCTGVGTSASCLAGAFTTPTVPNSQIPNFYVVAGQTYIFVISSNLPRNAGICFNFKIGGATCPAPAEIEYNNLLQTSASFSWNNVQNLVSTWEYVAIPAANGAPTGTETLTTTTTNIGNNVTGLTPDTKYNLYVRSVCGGVPGPWAAPFLFRTQCATYNTPYYTGFTTANATNPEACWTSLDLNNDLTVFNYGNNAYSEPVAKIRTSGNNLYMNDMLVSPQVHFDGVTQKRVRFKYMAYPSYNGTTTIGESSFEVRISTTGVGENNFTTVVLPLQTYFTGFNFIEKTIVLPANIVGDVNVAWVLPLGSTQTAIQFYIDDVYIEDLPACSNPAYPVVSNITTTSAELTWINGYQETQWEVSVQPLGTGAPIGPGLVVNSNPYTITGLIPSLRYEFYVRAHCSGILQSEWIGPIYFSTLCIPLTTPYYESFNDVDLSSKKFCWSFNNVQNDFVKWVMHPTEARIGRAGNTFTSFNDYLISPAISVSGLKKLSFKYRSTISLPVFPTSRGALEVLISTTDTNPSSFTVLDPLFEFTNSYYLEKNLFFNETGTIYIAFRVPPEMVDPANSGYLYLDDVRIEDAEVCPKPKDLLVSSVTTNSANLSWTPGYQETQWSYHVQPVGSGVPTVSGTLVTTNSATASGLLPGTEYEYYVKSVCGTDTSSWAGPIKFRTLCTAFVTPFIETFDGNSVTEQCWRSRNLNGDQNFWSLNYPAQPIAGDQMAAMFIGTNGDNDDYLISPTITLQANQRVRFKYKIFNVNFPADLTLKMSTTGIDPANFTTTLFDTGADVLTNTTVLEKVINLPSGVTGNVNFTFHIPFFPPNPWGYRAQYIFIDNFIVEDIPTCSPVTNVTAFASDVNATIDWTPMGSETSWELSVQPFGTAAPIGATLPQYLHTATAHPYVVNGLAPATKYQYYVRAICSGTSQSEWVGPFEILTKCDSSNLCQYTVTLSNGITGRPVNSIDVYQNGGVVQALTFPNNTTPLDYTVFLCKGVEFSLFWNMMLGGSGLQYSAAQITVKDFNNNIVWTSPLGLGTAHTTLYTGFASCGPETCAKPTNLTVSNQGVLSWTAGGTETQWEVFLQPVGNGTLPQTGIIVNTNSYTPVASDFVNGLSATYEYFVRAVCSSSDKSFWNGPKVFVRNDESNNAVTLQVNNSENCSSIGTNVTFMGATASVTPNNCGGTNGGDVWFDFVATSKVHLVELSDFTPGSYYGGSFQQPFPKIMMTLFEVQPDGSLLDKGCSDNNTFLTHYSSELVIGKTYKIRLMLNASVASTKTFKICITTPQDVCNMNPVNYDFEKVQMQGPTGITSILRHEVVPGWRVNTTTGTMFFQEATNSVTVYPYSGGQCLQLIHDPANQWDATDPNIKGLYKDFDTSEITVLDYNFATAARSISTIQLYAGPPSGPFTLLTEVFKDGLNWDNIIGSYTIPAGQNKTRFIFRTKEYGFGHLLDAVIIKPNTKIITPDTTLTCLETSTTVSAEGVGQWIASSTNPAQTIIATPNAKTTTISGFNVSGVYTYTWKTRYCEDTISITYQGIPTTPTVTSPVTYCANQTALALTATVPSGFTQMWYINAVGGTGSSTPITPSTSTVGTSTYYVGAVDTAGCVGPRTAVQVVINPLNNPITTFTLPSQICKSQATLNPVLSTNFTTGGQFTSTAGLSINASTGQINLAQSTAGLYTVSYNYALNNQLCLDQGASSQTVKISDVIDFDIASNCVDQSLELSVVPLNSTFEIQNATFNWQTASGANIGTNPILNVDDYIIANPSLVLPIVFSVTSTAGACSLSKSFTVDKNNCKLIPRGISPNNDGDNDTFDLSGMNVKSVSIFNRYGTEVYSFKGNYTNQWNGNSDSGSALPDGTYFYNVQKSDGTTVTGWVYINRQY